MIKKRYQLNFGPQHPAAHGVLRLILELEAEIVKSVNSNIGLLHRGTEKLIEYKTLPQALPYFDRLDYVSMMAQEHCFALVVEKLANITIPKRAQLIRIIFLELTRILNHIMAITTHAMDIGAITPFLWLFEEREKIMEFYERVSGARMHSNYIRPGGVFMDVPLGFFRDVFNFLEPFLTRLDEVETMLTANRVWQERMLNVGIIEPAFANNWAFSGVMLRGSGVAFDLRLMMPYEGYETFEFFAPLGEHGDCFDRFFVRLEEMRQSTKIIFNALQRITVGPIKIWDQKVVPPPRLAVRNSMEGLIHHFKFYTDGFIPELLSAHVSVEAPKGEFGVSLFTKEMSKPYRCRIRSPGFFHLQSLKSIARDISIADLVAIVGTLDLVLGEIDR